MNAGAECVRSPGTPAGGRVAPNQAARHPEPVVLMTALCVFAVSEILVFSRKARGHQRPSELSSLRRALCALFTELSALAVTVSAVSPVSPDPRGTEVGRRLVSEVQKW